MKESNNIAGVTVTSHAVKDLVANMSGTKVKDVNDTEPRSSRGGNKNNTRLATRGKTNFKGKTSGGARAIKGLNMGKLKSC